MKTGVEIIAEERKRQIDVEGWSFKNDDRYTDEELAYAAVSYGMPLEWREPVLSIPATWPWAIECWKPTPDDRIKELAKAGALIAAEIDRLQRIKTK